MRHPKTDNTLSLLGGAILGAAAMYLLDPEQGRRRRETIGEVTGEALRATGDAVGPAWDTISERVREASSRMAEGAGALGAAAAARTTDAAGTAAHAGGNAYAGARDALSDWTDALGSLGRRWTKQAGTAASGVSDRARTYLPWHEEEESHATAYTVAGLSAAALGAGLIYFLDPNNGRRRRAVAGQQVNRIINDCGRAFNQSGRYVHDLMNRGKGVAHETRSRFGGAAREPVTPDVLVSRVRSEMGHVVSQAGGIDVVAESDGTITLTGRVLASEVDALMTTINRVPGVSQIINRLDVSESTAGFSSGQTGVSPSL